MTAASVEQWLDGLGYADQPDLLHRRGEPVSSEHPYALEIHALLQRDGSVCARAVFDVEGVPTIAAMVGILLAPEEDVVPPIQAALTETRTADALRLRLSDTGQPLQQAFAFPSSQVRNGA